MKYLICSKYKQKNIVEKFVFLLFIVFLIGICFDANGQIKPLDNGDLEVLKKKDLQNETYIIFTKYGSFNSTGISTLLRYGIKKNIELQVNWQGTRRETILGRYSVGAARVGIKAFLVDDSKYLPGISLIGSINLTADPSYDPLLPALNILYRKGITKNLTLTGNANFILNEQSSQLTYDYTANLDVNLTNWLTSYIGVKGMKSYGSPRAERAYFDEYVELGMLFWIADGLRLYPYYDLGLDDASDDIFNIGILYQFK